MSVELNELTALKKANGELIFILFLMRLKLHPSMKNQEKPK